MLFADFEKIISAERMNRYMLACNGDTKKAMKLYRKNLQLSQELFTVISCFEVALRNAIDKKLVETLGDNWLKTATGKGGIFDNPSCKIARASIKEAKEKLRAHDTLYSHSKLVAGLGFGFWLRMFAYYTFKATGKVLSGVFPAMPESSETVQYNSNFIYGQLAQVNNVRNRIAHHEPICFLQGQAAKDTSYVREHYNLILQLFKWMGIDEAAFLYGLDHIDIICDQIDEL